MRQGQHPVRKYLKKFLIHNEVILSRHISQRKHGDTLVTHVYLFNSSIYTLSWTASVLWFGKAIHTYLKLSLPSMLHVRGNQINVIKETTKVSFLFPPPCMPTQVMLYKFVTNIHLKSKYPSWTIQKEKSPHNTLNYFPPWFHKCNQYLSSCVTPQSRNLSPFWYCRASKSLYISNCVLKLFHEHQLNYNLLPYPAL